MSSTSHDKCTMCTYIPEENVFDVPANEECRDDGRPAGGQDSLGVAVLVDDVNPHGQETVVHADEDYRLPEGYLCGELNYGIVANSVFLSKKLKEHNVCCKHSSAA